MFVQLVLTKNGQVLKEYNADSFVMCDSVSFIQFVNKNVLHYGTIITETNVI